jgi:hypothetical protein
MRSFRPLPSWAPTAPNQQVTVAAGQTATVAVHTSVPVE